LVVNLLSKPCESLLDTLERKITDVVDKAGPLKGPVSHVLGTKGKRLRPLLLIETSLASSINGNVPYESLTDVALAVELIHTASLIHDDIIDGAHKRRGRNTLHTFLGTHLAVLTGDLLFTKANEIAQSYTSFGVPSILTQATILTIEGEAAQDIRLYDPTVTETDYLSHISKKTAALFGAACQCGAALARADDKIERELLWFGLELGCAFQIADDLADICGDPLSSQKPRGKDLREGIMTLPLILAMSSPAGPIIREAFSKRQISDEDARLIYEEAQRAGCLETSRDCAIRLLQRAEKRLSCLNSSSHREVLHSIVGQIMSSMTIRDLL
jgi:geranylgeranyl pyrophosphate synthase